MKDLQRKGRSEKTVSTYRRNIAVFYQDLPEDKQVGPDTLAEWSADLVARGYKPRSVNTRISAVNSLLTFLNLREYQLVKQIKPPQGEAKPELTRSEYLRLLSAAQMLGKEQAYFMVKIFTCIGLNVEDLSRVTVATVKGGRVMTESNGVQRIVPIPSSLRNELLAYIGRTGIQAGPIFVARSGKQLNRSTVTAVIRHLARDARVEEGKCNPRCLRRLYQTTREKIEAELAPILEENYERLLDEEQETIGWEN